LIHSSSRHDVEDHDERKPDDVTGAMLHQALVKFLRRLDLPHFSLADGAQIPPYGVS